MKPLRSSYPVGHLLNPATRYVPADQTDVRKTFARIRRQQEIAAKYPETDVRTWPPQPTGETR